MAVPPTISFFEFVDLDADVAQENYFEEDGAT